MRRGVVRSYEELARILDTYHAVDPAAHKGINDVVDNISKVHYWRNIKKDVKHYVCIAIGILVSVMISSICLWKCISLLKNMAYSFQYSSVCASSLFMYEWKLWFIYQFIYLLILSSFSKYEILKKGSSQQQSGSITLGIPIFLPDVVSFLHTIRDAATTEAIYAFYMESVITVIMLYSVIYMYIKTKKSFRILLPHERVSK